MNKFLFHNTLWRSEASILNAAVSHSQGRFSFQAFLACWHPLSQVNAYLLQCMWWCPCETWEIWLWYSGLSQTLCSLYTVVRACSWAVEKLACSGCKASFCFVELGTCGVGWSVLCCWFPVSFHILVDASIAFLGAFFFPLCSFAMEVISVKRVIKVLREILGSIFEPLASKSCPLKVPVSDFKWLAYSVTFIWPVSISRCFLVGFVFYHSLTILQLSFWSFQDLCM